MQPISISLAPLRACFELGDRLGQVLGEDGMAFDIHRVRIERAAPPVSVKPTA